MEVLNTISYAVTAAATVALFVGAILAWRTAKKTLKQMELDSKAQTRPYVHVRLEPSIGGSKAWDLVLSNTGRTVAKNVRFTVSPKPTREDDVTRDMAALASTRQHLAPDTQVRSFWDLGPTNEDDETTNRGFVGEHIVTISYDDQEGEEYADTFKLDASAFKMTPVGWEGAKNDKQGTIEDRLNNIVRAISELRRNQ